EVFQVPVYSHYGMAEHIALAGFGKDDHRYHFMPLYSFIEFKPNCQYTGLHRIIGSNFWNQAMILLRYDIGDFVELGEGSVDFSSPVRTLVGRALNHFVLKDKSLLSATVVVPGYRYWNSFRNISQLQFEQLIPGRVVVRLEATSGFSEHDFHNISKVFSESARGKLDVILEIGNIQRTESGKVPLVVQSPEIKAVISDKLANV
ncbi:MAG: hypothetical protein DRH24_13500, partial [Deltaproteobacteria bacterium]